MFYDREIESLNGVSESWVFMTILFQRLNSKASNFITFLFDFPPPLSFSSNFSYHWHCDNRPNLREQLHLSNWRVLASVQYKFEALFSYLPMLGKETWVVV